jgi:septum formation topological specificity factor MinE
MMEILSPKKIHIANGIIMFNHTSSFEYTDTILNVPMTKKIMTLSFGQRKNDNETTIDVGIAMGRPSEEQLIIFAGMQALINSCVDNAEDIKDRLLQIVLARSMPKTEEERIEIMKMDFMNLRQSFMDDIRKSKIYKEFEDYSSTGKLKPFSQAFHTFITDRNKYTHGQLCFIKPTYDFVLQYIETPGQKTVYASIDKSILLSYNNCYKEILKVITAYSVIHQTRTITAYKMKNNIVD